MATQGERLAALEQRMDTADKERAEILRTVKAIHDKITLSRGAVIGAVGVVSALGGLGMFVWNYFAQSIADMVNTRP